MLSAAVAALAVGTAATAQTFEWRDERGRVQTADELPAAGTFTELRVSNESAALTPHVRRTIELINEHARESRFGTEGGNAGITHPIAPQDTAGAAPTIGTLDLRATENVRDPCLLSWDPQCIEKHAADYDPRLGYAPSILRSAVAPRPTAGAETARPPAP